MNKKIILILLCVVTLALVVLSFLSLAASQGSIGIIGGADGPTAIFVTGNPTGLYITTGLFLVAAVVWYLIYRTGNVR